MSTTDSTQIAERLAKLDERAAAPRPPRPSEQQALIPLPSLLAPDGGNLADDRVPCGEGCEGERCERCRGKLTVAAPTGREDLHQSAITTLLNCEQRYAFEHVHHLELITRSKPLDMGRAFQFAIEHGDPAKAGDMLAHSRGGSLDQAQEDALRVDMAIVVCAAKTYLSRWPERERSEFEFRVRLRNPFTGRYSNTFDLAGSCDGLTDLGESWELEENKLVGQINAGDVTRLPLNRQVSLYCYGVWRATGKPVSRVRYRYTRKPSIRPLKATAKKPAETIGQFIGRLHTDYEERRDSFYLYEDTLYRSSEDLVRVEAELWRWAEQLRAARRQNVWARNSSHCGDWGGCPFIPLCIGDPDALALYRQRAPAERHVLSEATPTEEVTL